MKNLFSFILLSLSLFLLACSNDPGQSSGNSSDENQSTTSSSSDEPKNLQDAMKQMEEAVKNVQGGEKVEVVSFRELQELMPEKLNGYNRTEKGGETTGALGMNVSTAKATYKKGDQTIDIDIIDTGGIGMAMMGIAAWTTLTVDKEDDNGYERTGTISGNKSFEKFHKNGATSEVSVIVNKRFVVNARARLGNEGQMDDLKDMVKSLSLGKLERK